MGSYTVKNSCGIKCKKENTPQVVYTISKADQGTTGTTGAQGATGLTDQEIKKKIIEARKNAADSDRKMREALKQHQSQQANSYKKERDKYNAEAKKLEGSLGRNKNTTAQSTSNIQGASGSTQHTGSGNSSSKKENDAISKASIKTSLKKKTLHIKCTFKDDDKATFSWTVTSINDIAIPQRVASSSKKTVSIDTTKLKRLESDYLIELTVKMNGKIYPKREVFVFSYGKLKNKGATDTRIYASQSGRNLNIKALFTGLDGAECSWDIINRRTKKSIHTSKEQIASIDIIKEKLSNDSNSRWRVSD